MTQKSLDLQSQYGPVQVELHVCDGPACTAVSQPRLMLNWYRVKVQGQQIATLGQAIPDDSDFCSTECLSAYLTAATGA